MWTSSHKINNYAQIALACQLKLPGNHSERCLCKSSPSSTAPFSGTLFVQRLLTWLIMLLNAKRFGTRNLRYYMWLLTSLLLPKSTRQKGRAFSSFLFVFFLSFCLNSLTEIGKWDTKLLQLKYAVHDNISILSSNSDFLFDTCWPYSLPFGFLRQNGQARNP